MLVGRMTDRGRIRHNGSWTQNASTLWAVLLWRIHWSWCKTPTASENMTDKHEMLMFFFSRCSATVCCVIIQRTLLNWPLFLLNWSIFPTSASIIDGLAMFWDTMDCYMTLLKAEWEVNQQEGEEEFHCYMIWQMMVALLHSTGQLRTERDGDTEKGCQKPAVQQKTTDDAH